MSDDLVKRLRAIDKDIILRRFDPEMSFDGMTAHNAADRIEKLEAALRLIIEHPVELSQQWQIGCNEMQKVARKALEGKNE